MVQGQGLISARYLEPDETKGANPERLIDIMPVSDINVFWSVEFAIYKISTISFPPGRSYATWSRRFQRLCVGFRVDEFDLHARSCMACKPEESGDQNFRLKFR